MNLSPIAARGRAWALLVGAGGLIAGAFWTLAWLAPRPGEPLFMVIVSAAAVGYVAALGHLARGAVISPRLLAGCLVLALAWRAPLLALPGAPAHDAVRYLWDARVGEAGLSPYAVRPDDPALASLHSDVTREVDAAWLPTIYPPAAQLYFRAVAAMHRSITAFRVATLASDIGIIGVLAAILRMTGQPLGWVLLYAWHPLLPLEGVGGAHVDFFGALALLMAWLALLHGRTSLATLAFTAAVLVKPLPLVLAPLLWRRVRLQDALLAAGVAGAITLWIARGTLPFGSTGAFLEDFRFNGPLFASMETVLSPRMLAAVAVAAGFAAAAWLRRTRDVTAPEAWAWPMALALLASPVVYPWYLVWLIPFAISRSTIPVWIWTLSVLVIYHTWHLRRLGAPFVVPTWLLAVEFALPAIAAVLLIRIRPSPLPLEASHG